MDDQYSQDSVLAMSSPFTIGLAWPNKVLQGESEEPTIIIEFNNKYASFCVAAYIVNTKIRSKPDNCVDSFVKIVMYFYVLMIIVSVFLSII